MSSKLKINQSRFYKSCETFVTKLYKSHPPIYRALHGIIQRYKKRPSDMQENFQKLIELIRNDKTLISEMNKLLHSNLKIPFMMNTPDAEKARKMQFESKIQDCFNILTKKNPLKLDRIIDFLKENGKQNQDTLDLAEKVLKQLKEILSDEPELYNEMGKILNEFLISEKQKNLNEMELENAEDYIDDTVNESAISKPARPNKSIKVIKKPLGMYGYPQGQSSYGNGAEGPEVGENSNNFSNHAGNYVCNTVSIPVAMKNEWQFFENVKMKLNHNNYEDLIKCVFLYSECIISSYELFVLTKDIFKDYEMFYIFRDIMLSRENSRRKTTPFFKPSGELELSKSERNTHSYIKLPDNFPKRRLNSDELSRANINSTWVSIAVGSEHYTFTNMRKNAYEEALFKCEDERFEFDININCYKRGIMLLERIANNESNEEARKRDFEGLVKMKIMQGLYGAKLNEFIEEFNKGDYAQIKSLCEIFLARLRPKLNELTQIKHSAAKKNWSETAEKNFHKSLDHRSFYFKKQEKRLTAQNRFIAEAEFRYNIIMGNSNVETSDNNKENMEKNPEKYLDVLNTFDGITLGYKCEHGEDDENIKFDELKNLVKMPIYKFRFSNKEIVEDTFAFLCFHVNNYHFTMNEKEKVKKLIKNIFVPLLEIQPRVIEYNENMAKEERIVKIVSKIEHSIFDKNFTYFANPNKENVLENLQENHPKTHASINPDLESESKKESHIHSGENDENGKNGHDSFENYVKNAQDSFDKCLDSNSFDEENETFKEMLYLEDDKKEACFLPEESENTTVFYGTKLLYTLLRFFYTLYERFLMAYEMCQFFENNPKCEALTNEEKASLVHERYEMFKLTLLNFIKQKFDTNKYEDFIRGLFGNNAFLFFTVDKILSLTTKACQSVSNDELSIKILNLFVNTSTNQRISKRLREEIYFTRINEMSLENINNPIERNFYRFLFSPKSQTLHVNYFETPTKNWEKENFQQISRYFERMIIDVQGKNQTKNSMNPVFLRRNQEKIKRKKGFQIQSCLRVNGIEYKSCPNTSKIISDNKGSEDIMINKDCKRNRKREFSTEFQKTKKFKAWYEKCLLNLLK